MTIRNSVELTAFEYNIGQMLRLHTLDGVLLGLHQAPPSVKPFMKAGTALFAVRYCLPGLKTVKKAARWGELSLIVHRVTEYLLTDPAVFTTHTGPVDKSTLSILLRTGGSQFPFEWNNDDSPGRWLTMYEDLPKEVARDKKIKKFDFEEKFRAIYNVSVEEFVLVCFVAWAGTHALDGITREYFQKAREDGAQIPNDEIVVRVLEHIAASPSKVIKMYKDYKQKDRQFAAYDYNPLQNYPIIRPWEQSGSVAMNEDCFIAPVPHLITSRVTSGIYDQMRHEYKNEFSQYFGHLFEAYVGRVLKHCVDSAFLFSDKEIRQAYQSPNGKAIDWIVVEGNLAVLIECKAVRLNREAMATGGEQAIRNSLRELQSGLTQLHQFQQACKARRVGINALKSCTKFVSVLVTLRDFYLANSSLLGELLDEGLEQGVAEMPKIILSIEQFELLQSYVSAGHSMGVILTRLESESLQTVFSDVQAQVGNSNEFMFYHEREEQFYAKLGVPN